MITYLLDTDIFSEYLREDASVSRNTPISRRIALLSSGQVVLSVITIAEVMRGVLGLLQRLEKAQRDPAGYAELHRALDDLYRFPFADYTEVAQTEFERFSPAVRRIGRRDCQIAAIALVHDYTVITRNTQDFAHIPGIVYEDWAQVDTT